MRTVRLCTVVGSIFAMCLTAANADEQFTILGDASYDVEYSYAAEPIMATAYQDQSAVPPPPADAEAGPAENAPYPEGNYEYHGPTPHGPAVIEEGWSDVWNHCCEPWCKLGYIVGGVEGVFLAPIDEPTQFVRFTDLTNGRRYRGDADPSFGAGIRTWLGLEQDGSGVRARYLHFRNDVIDVDPDVPFGNGPAFIENYDLTLNVLDVELYHNFCFAHHTINASFGARYAHIERNGAVTGFGTVGGVDLLGLAFGTNEIEGTGFTASIGGSKPLGCGCKQGCDSCCGPCCGSCCQSCCGWNFFWNVRGSVLWADAKALALTDANATVNSAVGSATAGSRDKAFAFMDKDNVWNLEGQIGLEYNFCMCCMPGIFSLRGGFEVQHWDTGDLLAESNSFAFLQNANPPLGGLVEAESDGHDGDLTLLGFFLGLQYKF